MPRPRELRPSRAWSCAAGAFTDAARPWPASACGWVSAATRVGTASRGPMSRPPSRRDRHRTILDTRSRFVLPHRRTHSPGGATPDGTLAPRGSRLAIHGPGGRSAGLGTAALGPLRVEGRVRPARTPGLTCARPSETTSSPDFASMAGSICISDRTTFPVPSRRTVPCPRACAESDFTARVHRDAVASSRVAFLEQPSRACSVSAVSTSSTSFRMAGRPTAASSFCGVIGGPGALGKQSRTAARRRRLLGGFLAAGHDRRRDDVPELR